LKKHISAVEERGVSTDSKWDIKFFGITPTQSFPPQKAGGLVSYWNTWTGTSPWEGGEIFKVMEEKRIFRIL